MVSMPALVKLKAKHTFGTELSRPLINQRAIPAPDYVHDMHYRLSFRSEAGNGFALDNGLSGGWIINARKDGRSVAAARCQRKNSSATCWK
jgi:hypothetical protein